jgi:hypothetical protein
MRVQKSKLFDIAINASALWLLSDKNSSLLEAIVNGLWKGSVDLCTTLDTNYQMKTNFNMATRLFDMLLVTVLSNASEQLKQIEYDNFEELLIFYKEAILTEGANS